MPPILAPVIRKIRIMAAELAPIERKTAMSAFFDLTNIIIDETILKAATNMISVRIRNITFRSTCRALIKVRFLSCQSNRRYDWPRRAFTAAETRSICKGLLEYSSMPVTASGKVKND